MIMNKALASAVVVFSMGAVAWGFRGRGAKVVDFGLVEPLRGQGHAKVAPKVQEPSPLDRETPIPPDFAMLLNRSVFVPKQAQVAAPDPSTVLSVKGISDSDDADYTAFLEDSSHRIIQVRKGEKLEQGQVTDITLHEVAYESAGKVVRAGVGDSISISSTGPAVVVTAPLPPLPVVEIASTPEPSLKPERRHRKNRPPFSYESQAAIDLRH